MRPLCARFRSSAGLPLFLAKHGDGGVQGDHIGVVQRCRSGGLPAKLLAQGSNALTKAVSGSGGTGKLGRDQGDHNQSIARLDAANQDRVRARVKRSTAAGARMADLTKGWR